MKIAAREFKGMQNPHAALYPFKHFEIFGLQPALVANYADNREFFAGGEMRLETHVLDVGYNVCDFFRRRLVLHNNDHCGNLLEFGRRRIGDHHLGHN